jgi:lipoprotein signal peptidase
MPGLLIGGAAANLTDRIAFGAVHDWLRVGSVVLNLADVVILVAGIGVLVSGSSLAHRSGPTPPATGRA